MVSHGLVETPQQVGRLVSGRESLDRRHDAGAYRPERQDPERLFDHDPHLFDVEQCHPCEERRRNGEPASVVPKRQQERLVPEDQKPGRDQRVRDRDGGLENELGQNLQNVVGAVLGAQGALLLVGLGNADEVFAEGLILR